jgi:c-di-GMP-binding flagellar brake protein YcgR
LKEKLKAHQRVQLNIVEGQYKGNYYSRIEDLVGDETIIVALPPVDNAAVMVHVGDIINVFYWDSMAQYAFEAKVINRQDGVTPTITLEKHSEVQRMQRRSYFRIQTGLRVVFSVERDDDDESAEPQYYEGLTLNISGGGMLLSTSVKLEMGDTLLIKLYLSEQEYMVATGRVERLEYLASKDLYRAGIIYVAIHENDRDKIIAFVFKKEIDLRKKGLL